MSTRQATSRPTLNVFAVTYTTTTLRKATAKMKIKELQEKIADALNGVEELVQAGCTAFAEDSREVYDRAAQLVREGRVAIVVITPELTRNGSNTDGAVPAETQLQIQCSESPAVARGLEGSMTALDAAEIVRVKRDRPSVYASLYMPSLRS